MAHSPYISRFEIDRAHVVRHQFVLFACARFEYDTRAEYKSVGFAFDRQDKNQGRTGTPSAGKDSARWPTYFKIWPAW